MALARASARGRGALVAALLADWSANRSVAPALHRAADAGHAEIVKALAGGRATLMRRRRGGRRWRWPSTRGAWTACAPCSGRRGPIAGQDEAVPAYDGRRRGDSESLRRRAGGRASTRPEDVAAELAACVAAAPSSAVAEYSREGERALAPCSPPAGRPASRDLV